MEYEDLLVEKKDGIATITLNAPDKRNVLTRGMSTGLPLALDEIATDDEVRVVIITGAGRTFCAGADVNMLAGMGGTQEVPRYQRFHVYGENWIDRFISLNKPIIGAINGACVGMGYSLALSFDVRIASETAKFGALFILRGLVPDTGMTYFLPRIVGTSKALELMFTGEMISAEEAERLGIVSRVVPDDKLMEVTQELAARIAQQPPIAIELTKKVTYRGVFGDLTSQLDLETWAQNICFQTEDFREAVRAFLEKRPQPQFKGK